MPKNTLSLSIYTGRELKESYLFPVKANADTLGHDLNPPTIPFSIKISIALNALPLLSIFVYGHRKTFTQNLILVGRPICLTLFHEKLRFVNYNSCFSIAKRFKSIVILYFLWFLRVTYITEMSINI